MKNKIFLSLVIILAFVLRFYRLGDYPALNADEAAIGYNAYSLIQTGKDEHGNSWPVHFQSFNDYKPGLYFYLAIPFVKFLGLNEWGVRIPGALLGVATVYIIYLLIKELKVGKSLKIDNWSLEIEEIGAFMLAISPWHLHFSRGAWEVNAGTFFIALGVLFFLRGLKSPKYYVPCTISWTLALYTYHSARVVVPLLGLGLLIIYFKNIKNNFKVILVAMAVGFVVLIPLMVDLFGPAGVSRAAGVGLFADPGPLNRINEQRGEHKDFTSLSTKLFHNKLVNYTLAFAQNWVEHFHGEFLFLSGDDIQRNKVPETGVMYLFDVLFLLVGFVFIVRNYSLNSNSHSLILWWLAVAPIAAALTFQSPHALRAHNMVIPLIVIGACGFGYLVTWLKQKNLKRVTNLLQIVVIWFIVILVAWQFARYQEMYWGHMSKEYSYSSQYGVKELSNYINENKDKYQKIWITDRYDQPYILLLFYMKYQPQEFQKGHVLTDRDRFGFSTVRGFDKFHFEEVNFDKIRPENPNSLIVGTDEEIPEEANIVKEIYGANGYKYFQVVAN